MRSLICVLLSIIIVWPFAAFAVNASDLDPGDTVYIDKETPVVVVRIINSDKIKVRYKDGSIGFYSASELKTLKDMEESAFIKFLDAFE